MLVNCAFLMLCMEQNCCQGTHIATEMTCVIETHMRIETHRNKH